MTEVRSADGLPIASLYGDATLSFIEFARTLTDDDWGTPCPCTPGWTVRDVLSHVSGVPDDGLAGRIDGAATEPWTASQVERNAHFGVDELIERWLGQYELFGAAIESMGEVRPPFDCHTHEHDVRQALGRAGNRNSRIVQVGAERMLGWLVDVPVALTVDLGDGRTVAVGQAGAPALAISMSEFEVFRSKLGRRSEQQVRSYPWVGSADAIDLVVEHWFTFGPSELRIDE